jgi:hypothetical protein
MGWFNKKPDPISDRARVLNQQIAALEAQIEQLNAKVADGRPAAADAKPTVAGPRLRSTALPQGAAAAAPATQPVPKPSEPIFEEIDQHRLQDRAEPASTPEHFNELGVRKYDFAAFLRRVKDQFSGPSTANPKLVNYLAAGSIQGLRPMRYEKRVARKRLLVLCGLLFLALAGIVAMFARHHG